MAVPDTTTFTLQDVVDVVNPTTDDLVDSFADAVAGDFDSSYGPGDETNLLQFRNYDGTTSLPSFLGSVGTAFAVNPCNPPLTMNITYYHNGSGTNPVVGDTVYSDSSGSTTFGGNSVRKMRANLTAGGTTLGFGRTADGIITGSIDCGPP